MRIGIIRLDDQGVIVACNGLIQLAKVPQRIAQVIVRLDVIWFDGERLSVAGDGFI